VYELFQPAFAKRDKKQTMIDLQGISTNCFKNQVGSVHFSNMEANTRSATWNHDFAKRSFSK
jgi:hypothetical protein